MSEQIIVSNGDPARFTAVGQSFVIREWSGGGPDYMHVHHLDDEAWHILEGTLTFKFADRYVEATAGTTVFVPAGVPHTYYEAHGRSRYLIILTPKLDALIAKLQRSPGSQHAEILREFDSEIV
jgi:hypothetical protein